MTTKLTKNVNQIKNILRFILIIIILLPIPLFWGIVLTAYKSTPNPDMAWVSWYDDPYQRVYIGWETNTERNYTVYYGTNPDNPSNYKIEPNPVRYHIMNLTNLTPNTTYYYKITDNGVIYTRGEFRTAPNTTQSFRFALTSDTQPKMGSGWHSQIADSIGKNQYAFVAIVGDIAEDGTPAEWYDYFSKANAYLKRTPIVPVQGNHDRPRIYTDNGSLISYFQEYFPQSVDQIINTNSEDNFKQFYYSFNYSNVHFQILHFPEVDIDDDKEPGMLNPGDYNSTFTQDHLDWIKKDLANAQSLPYRITLFHCPITGAGFYGPNYVLQNELLPILHEYNVTITVHGHAHHYGRGILANPIHPGNDLIFLNVGTGGGLADVGLRPQQEQLAVAGSPCYTEGYYHDNQLTFTTISPNGHIIDNFTLNYVPNVGVEIQ